MEVTERVVAGLPKTTEDAVVAPTKGDLPEHLQPVEQTNRATRTQHWGWLPILSLYSADGLVLISFADTAARSGNIRAETIFWIGLLLLYAPVAMRLTIRTITRRESLGLVLMLGLGLYLVKVLHSPLAFTHHDEFLHWRTFNDIQSNGHLFHHNPLLPVSALYPGLEIVTHAFASLSGMPFFLSGVVVIGIARLIFVLALFLLFEWISRSFQVAGIAVAIYMTNPNFLFFDAMFKYETLALSFAALTLYCVVRQEDQRDATRPGLVLGSILTLGAAIVSHHLTAYIFNLFLLLWTAVALYRRRSSQSWHMLAGITLLALIMNLVWLFTVANVVIEYLSPHVVGTVRELTRMIAGEQTAGRQLFRSSTGQVAPLWERLAGFGSVGLILLGLPFGLFQIWRRYRTSTIALALAISTFAYPASLYLRFTRRGWEIANRSSEFLFIALGLVLALGIVHLQLPGRLDRLRPLGLGMAASVLLLGGLIAGWPPFWRLPGTYIAQADTRSIEIQGIAAAEWARTYLGTGNRMATDRTNELLMGTYGGQFPVTEVSRGINTNWVLFAPQMNAEREALLKRAEIRYVVVDWRLTTVPRVARRFYPNVSLEQALAKFDHLSNVSCIFDSGDIAIYDVGAISGVP